MTMLAVALPPASRAIAIAIACALGACARSPRSGAAAPTLETRDVTLVAAALTPLRAVVVAHGSLAADEVLDLSFQHAGELAEVRVDLGTRVKAGELLARLDTSNFELAVRVADAAVRQSRVRLGLPADGENDDVIAADTPAVRQAQATLTEARTNLGRVQELLEQSLVAEAALDAARAVHDVAEGRLQQAFNDVRDHQATLAQRRVETELARRRLIESSLAAPFDGVVAMRYLAAPEYVRPGDRVLTLLRTQPLRLRLRIPEREASRLVLGQSVQFAADGAPGEHVGKLVRLSPEIDLATRTLLVEADVDNQADALRPGLFARATVEVGAPQPCVTVPPAALVTFAGVEKVFAVRDGRAVERPVKGGRRTEDAVEIVEGLAATDLVVATPGDLVHGQPVKVLGH